MAGDWIKFEKATLDKPEVFEMAGLLGIDPDAVIGKLLRVWDWFDDQSKDGCAPVTLAAQLNRNTGCADFTQAMIEVGWLEVSNNRLTIPNFDRHNGETSKARALSAKRMAKSRKKCYADTATSSVTKTQPEKRREEKSNNPPNPQGGTNRRKKLNPKTAKVAANSPTMIRINSWFERRPETLWTLAEADALESADPSEAELDGMEAFYTAPDHPDAPLHRRTAVITLLNNWPSELDKARNYARKRRAE
jgi:hypothetical protein